MKRRLSQPALPSMDFSLTGQQPFAKQALCTLQAFSFHETVLVRDKHVTNVVGMIEQVGFVTANFEANDIAVLSGKVVEIC
jgi:hypothetical protein